MEAEEKKKVGKEISIEELEKSLEVIEDERKK